MTTYSKETALYDTGAISTGITNAEKTATNYLTTISGTTGISVHDANDEKNFVNMNATDGVTIYRNIDGTATDVANFGEYVRVGKSGESKIELSNKQFFLSTEDETVLEISSYNSTPYTRTIRVQIQDYDQYNKPASIGSDYEIVLNKVDDIPIGTEFQFGIYFRDNFIATATVTKGTSWNGIMQRIDNQHNVTNVFDCEYDGGKTFALTALDSGIFWTIRLEYTVTSNAPYLTYGTRKEGSITGPYSATFGRDNEASGVCSVAAGDGCVASGRLSQALVSNAKSLGTGSFAAGQSAEAHTLYSTAIGHGAKAYGYMSTAIGNDVIAPSRYSMAIGNSNRNDHFVETFTSDGITKTFVVSNNISEVVEVYFDDVKQTITRSVNGKQVQLESVPPSGSTIKIEYSTSQYALIIGNGSNGVRSNALTVDWSGGIRTTPEQIATNVVSTKGQYVSSKCYRFGQVVYLSLFFRNTSSVAAGADIYTATFTSTLPRPAVRVTGASYYGLHSIAGAVDTNGGVTIRNASNTAFNIPSNSSAGISFTYITND